MELANNFMLQICVADIQGAFDLCSRSLHKRKFHQLSNNIGEVFSIYGARRASFFTLLSWVASRLIIGSFLS